MSNRSDATPRPRPGLGEQVIDGEVVLVNASGGEILVLNECGALVWRLLDGERNVDDLVHQVQEDFEVDEATARADVEEFLGQLASRDLLET